MATEASMTSDDATTIDQRVEPNAMEEIKRHETLAEENVYVGLMFGSKALVQLLANPWIGPLTNKFVYRESFLKFFINNISYFYFQIISNMKYGIYCFIMEMTKCNCQYLLQILYFLKFSQSFVFILSQIVELATQYQCLLASV